MDKKMKPLTLAMLSSLILFGCADEEASQNIQSNYTSQTTFDTEVVKNDGKLVTYEDEDYVTDYEANDATTIRLNDGDVDVKGDGAVFQDGIVQIKAGGVYVIEGSWSDGQIRVDAEDDSTVRLILNGVDITSETSAPVYIQNAEKTIITLVDGTTNYLSDAETYTYDDEENEEPSAALFSKDDLVINGTGNLTIRANFNDALTGKDELRIVSGAFDIESVDDGIIGRDLLAINQANMTIEAGGDALKTTNDKDASLGQVVIESGTYALTAGSDGIQAVTDLTITDGTYQIVSGGGSPDTIETFEERPNQPTATTTATEDETSMKGLKAGGAVTVTGGEFGIDASDDAIHSNATVIIEAGTFQLTTGDDGIHADETVTVDGGTINVLKSYEGIEGKVVNLNGGTIDIKSADDGINAAGGNDGSGWDMAATEGALIAMNGSTITIDAGGDGIDSNGEITMSDGVVIVNGPTDTGNTSLDFDGTFDWSGGFLAAAGGSSMLQAPSDTSQAGTIVMTFSDMLEAGTIVHVENSAGDSIATLKPSKDYQSVIMSSPDFVVGETYTLSTGGEVSGESATGLYEGSYTGGEQLVEFTLDDVVTWLNESGVTTPQTGMGMGNGGQRPGGDGAMPPEKPVR